jgi:hypothetical protein
MMNWKECGNKWLWHVLRYYQNICLERLRKTMDNLKLFFLHNSPKRAVMPTHSKETKLFKTTQKIALMNKCTTLIIIIEVNK